MSKRPSPFQDQNSRAGFSLIELMIVVGIISVLATLAIPRFRQFERKAKMAEARNMIQQISNLEHSYHIANNQFINLGPLGASMTQLVGANLCDRSADPGALAIGFFIDPCIPNAPIPRYYYRVNGSDSSRFVASGATANLANNRVCPGNNHHYLAINQDHVVHGQFASNNPINSSTLPDLTAMTACPLN